MPDAWITTKGGDKGETSLGDGTRVPKDHPRVEGYGTLDECQAAVGLARSMCEYPEICEQLCVLERDLGLLMGHLARYPGLGCPEISVLEEITERVRTITGETFRFVRPGDSKAGAALHMARTIARRAERTVVTLYRSNEIEEGTYRYINRLSDVMYALSLWYDHLERLRRGATDSCNVV